MSATLAVSLVHSLSHRDRPARPVAPGGAYRSSGRVAYKLPTPDRRLDEIRRPIHSNAADARDHAPVRHRARKREQDHDDGQRPHDDAG